MSEYRIPIRHERGTYTLAEVEVTDEIMEIQMLADYIFQIHLNQ